MVLAIALGGAAAAFVTGWPGSGPAPQQAADPELMGADGVPLLTEFADFNCQYCQRFHHIILPELRRTFLDNGSVEYRYRHYPFLAESSTRAAEMAECAREQNAFPQYQDALYRTAETRSVQGQAIQPADIAAAAEAAALEPEGLLECLESGRGERAAAADRELGERNGVRGTPALFLEGRAVRWEDYADLERQIREELEGRRN